MAPLSSHAAGKAGALDRPDPVHTSLLALLGGAATSWTRERRREMRS